MRTESSHEASKLTAGLARRVVSGPTMGTRFAAVFFAPPALAPDTIGKALAEGVGEVDRQMSTWDAGSDLMRFNHAPAGMWVDLPARLLLVMEAGLEIGRASGGAFDIGVLDLMRAWGFVQHDGAPFGQEVDRLAVTCRRPAHEVVEIDRPAGRAIKHEQVGIDLSGIAKGYGVDRLAEVLLDFGIRHFLVSIDGEVRAHGGKPDGSAWRVAVEQPDPTKRDVAGVVELMDGALATSGNYRHRRQLRGQSFSHTMDARSGWPATDAIQSATVRAPSCMSADAWATVVMVLGEQRVQPLLAARGLSAVTIGPSST